MEGCTKRTASYLCKRLVNHETKDLRYFLEISYQGSRYHGWQKQQNALGIQSVVEDALQKLCRQPVEISGSGRTDTGVHAKQQWAHFEAELPFASNHLTHRLNAILPSDIAVSSLWEVQGNAHARFDAVLRSYEYHIHQQKSPFLEGLSYHFRVPLDLKSMNDCVGKIADGTERDYGCFSKAGGGQSNNLCRITSAAWEIKEDSGLLFRISANRFLRNMVRAIVGTLLDVGSGRMDAKGFERMLESSDRREAGRSVPAEGLYLSKIIYPPEIFIRKR